MHLLKQNNQYITFNSEKALKVHERLADKNIAVIDFESFQFDKINRDKFPLNIHSIPFSFSIGVVKYSKTKNKYELVSEYDYNYWKIDSYKDLINKIKNLALQMNQICQKEKIDQFVFLGAENELKCFQFFHDILKQKNINTIFQKGKLINRDYYDLYKFFNDKKYFNVLKYSFKISNFFKISDRPDPIKSRQIGIAAGKHFNSMVKGKASTAGKRLITKIIKHNLYDIYKGYVMINYLFSLTNVKENEVVNKKSISKTDCNIKFSIN